MEDPEDSRRLIGYRSAIEKPHKSADSALVMAIEPPGENVRVR